MCAAHVLEANFISPSPAQEDPALSNSPSSLSITPSPFLSLSHSLSVTALLFLLYTFTSYPIAFNCIAAINTDVVMYLYFFTYRFFLLY